jgi:hypothetical protein
MWMYPGLSCPDDFFSVELDNAEINTWIQEIIPLFVMRRSEYFSFGVVHWSCFFLS